jgi:hypothetical protein
MNRKVCRNCGFKNEECKAFPCSWLKQEGYILIATYSRMGKMFVKHNAKWYARRYPERSPLQCMVCEREIKDGETYESTYHGKNSFCWECANKTLLVYQPKHGTIKPHNKVEGFKKWGENRKSSYRQKG